MVTRRVDRDEWQGRLRNGRDFLQAARDALERSGDDANGNPIMSQIVLGVIAYGDALSIRFGGIQNQKDHRTLGDAIRQAMGNAADGAQLTRLGRIIKKKDQFQYDHRIARIQEARELLDQAERFCQWAEEALARR